MDNKRQTRASSFDQLFGPKEPSSSSSSSSSGIFASMFPPPPSGRSSGATGHASGNYGSPEKKKQQHNGKEESSGTGSLRDKIPELYQNEAAEPSCYFSSSIYYGGQENYSPRNPQTSESGHTTFKKKEDRDDDDINGNNPNSASRGNWWQGSLYY